MGILSNSLSLGLVVFVSHVLPHLATCSGRVAWSLGAARTGEHSAAGARFRSLQPVGVGWRCAGLEVPGNQIGSYLFWWFSGQICTVKASDKLWSCSHTQARAEPRTVKDSPFVVAHATVQTWLHTEDRGDRTGAGAVAGSKRVPTPSLQASPCPGWCQC